MNFIAIFAAQYLVFIIIVIGIAFFLHRPSQEKKDILVFSFVTLPIVFIISRLCAALYFNPRPFVNNQFLALIPHKANNGFPSDHTLLSSAAAMIIWHFNKKIGWFLMFLALIVGLARVYVGVHHYLDIFTSLFISFVVTIIIEKTIWSKVRSHHLVFKVFEKIKL
ncbi:MAG: phosphatase PAP2 family protein [Candidatus Magasanikbacteria bacterium]|nr:phosphatase PAP2 family protein [Candidatus Magasanikbacteria bacterium]